MIIYLINTDKTLKATYECYQGIITSIKNKNFKKFKKLILHPDNSLSNKIKQKSKLFQVNLKYIENSLKCDINNGIIEGTSNLIKSIKKSFGHKI